MSARYFAKRPGGPAYLFDEAALVAAFNRGEMDGWLVRRTDWAEWDEWVPVEDEFGEFPPRARRVSEPAPSVDDLEADLARLHDLKIRGLLDDAEHAALRQAALDRFTHPPPPARQPRALEPHRGGLILTLGILGCVPVLFIFAVLAASMGRHDLNRMRDGFMDRSGEDQTRTGFNLGACVSLLVGLMCGLGGLILFTMR